MAKIKKAELRELVKEIRVEREADKVTNAELELIIEDVFLAIKEAVVKGLDVNIGIGTLKPKTRAARKGVNPKLLKELKEQGLSAEQAKAQATIDIAESKTVTFTASKSAKEELNA